jgi:hypothetical protein
MPRQGRGSAGGGKKEETTRRTLGDPRTSSSRCAMTVGWMSGLDVGKSLATASPTSFQEAKKLAARLYLSWAGGHHQPRQAPRSHGLNISPPPPPPLARRRRWRGKIHAGGQRRAHILPNPASPYTVTGYMYMCPPSHGHGPFCKKKGCNPSQPERR